jgi:peptidoglycan/LPS O-acetylase OafA/YrhL
MAQLAQVLGEVSPAAAHAPHLVSLGKIGYGLYLPHLVGLAHRAEPFYPAWGRQVLATKALGLVMTVIFAFASCWIASPFPRMKDRFANVLSRPV